MSEAAFELSGVSYAYQTVSALDGLAMSVRTGERVALLGANGSGKSTCCGSWMRFISATAAR